MFFLFMVLDVKSQDKIKVDSLENLVKSHHDDDSTKVNLLSEIAFIVHNTDNNKSLKYSK